MSTAFYPLGMISYGNRTNQGGYKSWKGNNMPTGYTSSHVRPLINGSNSSNSAPYPFGIPHPLKFEFRQGLGTANNYIRSVCSSTRPNMISLLQDQPGRFSVTTVPNSYINTHLVVTTNSTIKPIVNLTDRPQPSENSNCTKSCKAYKRTLSSNTILPKNYFPTHIQLLESHNETFNQNLNTNENDCLFFNSNPNIKIKNCVVYKPNNRQFSQQGAVSSSTYLLKLKVNTITKSSVKKKK